MRLASVLTPMTDLYLAQAAQCGVTDIVHRFPGEDPQLIRETQQRIAAFGLRWSVVEGYLPIERIKLGEDDGRDLEAMKRLIRTMGQCEIPILCYNFMAGTDWVRTTLDAPERGGSRVTQFQLEAVRQAVLLGHDGGQHDGGSAASEARQMPRPGELWQFLERMLEALLPVAEEAGVALAMHPDDPPLPELLGKPRIMNCVESFQRLREFSASRSNGICFCQGTFAEMGADIPETIKLLGPGIRYVHFRDVRGTAEDFAETWHDNGPTDMAAAMRAYRAIGFDGPLRPDHVPQLTGEEDGEPGYTMLGRLFAYGYIRGLWQATA